MAAGLTGRGIALKFNIQIELVATKSVLYMME